MGITGVGLGVGFFPVPHGHPQMFMMVPSKMTIVDAYVLAFPECFSLILG